MSVYARRLSLVALRPAAARLAAAQGAILCRAQSSLITQFEASVASLPQREAVRYTAKNLKWTATEVKHFVDAHANALLEHGFVKGEVLALWLPDSAEKHVTLLAAAKIGLKVVDVDQSLATVADLRKILSTSACKAIFFEPVSKTQDNLLLLRKAIPEFFYYDDKYGQAFHSKHFPSLKYFVHTGFDIEMGCLNYKSLFLSDPVTSLVDTASKAVTDELPLYAKAASSLSFVSQSKALDEAAFGFAKKLIAKQYFESA